MAASGAACRQVLPSAGAGAAWMWQGPSGQPLDDHTVQEMTNFLSPSATRVRVLGGMRFNASQIPSKEWQAFGSYCFMLPRQAHTSQPASLLLMFQ